MDKEGKNIEFTVKNTNYTGNLMHHTGKNIKIDDKHIILQAI
jgi:hypothetical protein